MKLSDFFDKIFIIGSINSANVEHTINCLKQLDLYDENVMQYIYPSLNDIQISLDMNNDVNWRQDYTLSLALSHYSIIKQSYDAGFNHILILEDDNFFLNNIMVWTSILTNMPGDYNMLKFAGLNMTKNEYGEGSPLPMCDELIYNDYFRKITYLDHQYLWQFSAAAYALDRTAMEIYLYNQHDEFRVADDVNGVFKLRNATDNNNINIYMPIIPLIVPFGDIQKYGCRWYIDYTPENYI